MSIDKSTFLNRSYIHFDTRSLSDAELESKHGKAESSTCDLISFLAACQKLQVEFLPITWQDARSDIGRGGTSRINEAPVNLETSFAFKRLSDKQKEKNENDIFQTIINEITVLSHNQIREHPNIVELQGICWDVQPDDKVLPVLVFEKTQFGDMYNFLRLPVGRDLGASERLQLCIDVGIAIIDLHFSGFIHGDIKPENVLIFKEKTGRYTAKVTDFGYSTLFATENDRILMPRSWPWYAPEWIQECKPAQSRKMDIFSFGMLCFWAMFEKFFSGQVMLPEDVQWAKEYLRVEGDKYGTELFLEELKNVKGEQGLLFLSQQLAEREEGLNDDQKQGLQELFWNSLQYESGKRTDDLRHAFRYLVPNWSLPTALNIENFNVLDRDFEISWSIKSFYESDYRLRVYIHHCLEEKVHNAKGVSTSIDQNLAFQLAICYSIGFGFSKSDNEPGSRTQQALLDSGMFQEDLSRAIDRLHEWNSDEQKYRNTTYTAILDLGHVKRMDQTIGYRKDGKLIEAEAEIRRAIDDIGRHPRDSWISTNLHTQLASLLYSQGRSKEAMELEMQVMETNLGVLGQAHQQTLTSMTNLAVMYGDQGRRKEAEELQLKVIETSSEMLGQGDIFTLTSVANLATTYNKQGRWTEAEELQLQILDMSLKVLGQEHPYTLTTKSNLAATYWHQGYSEKSEELEVQVMEMSLRVLGPNHPDTLIIMANLALTYRYQGQWKEAENLLLQVVEASLQVLGPEHPGTLISQAELASTYRKQGRFEAAEELEIQTVEISKKTLGEDHPDTLMSMVNLASTYSDQGRWAAAEELLIQVIEKGKEKFEADHPHTLTMIANLASIYCNQGRYEAAEESYTQIIETRKNKFAEDHPDTMRVIGNLAFLYAKQGRLEASEELFLQVLDKNKRVLGVEHPNTLSTMANIAWVYKRQGQWTAAEALELEVMETRKKNLGVEHPDTLISLSNYAFTRKRQGRDIEAIQLMEQCVELRYRVLGDDHPDFVSSLRTLAQWELEHERSNGLVDSLAKTNGN